MMRGGTKRRRVREMPFRKVLSDPRALNWPFRAVLRPTSGLLLKGRPLTDALKGYLYESLSWGSKDVCHSSIQSRK